MDEMSPYMKSLRSLDNNDVNRLLKVDPKEIQPILMSDMEKNFDLAQSNKIRFFKKKNIDPNINAIIIVHHRNNECAHIMELLSRYFLSTNKVNLMVVDYDRDFKKYNFSVYNITHIPSAINITNGKVYEDVEKTTDFLLQQLKSKGHTTSMPTPAEAHSSGKLASTSLITARSGVSRQTINFDEKFKEVAKKIPSLSKVVAEHEKQQSIEKEIHASNTSAPEELKQKMIKSENSIVKQLQNEESTQTLASIFNQKKINFTNENEPRPASLEDLQKKFQSQLTKLN